MFKNLLLVTRNRADEKISFLVNSSFETIQVAQTVIPNLRQFKELFKFRAFFHQWFSQFRDHETRCVCIKLFKSLSVVQWPK